MSGMLDPRYTGLDIGSSASVLATRAALDEQFKEQQHAEAKAAFENMPEHQRDKMILNFKLMMARRAFGHGTPPRMNTLMRFVRQIDKGTPNDKGAYLTMSNGMYLHPTKGWRGSAKAKANG